MDQKQTHLKGTKTKAGRHILQEAKALPPEQGQQNFTISWEKVKQKRGAACDSMASLCC